MADEPRWIPGQNRKRALGASGGGATPTGPAGGDLGGTYPDPTVVRVDGVVFNPTPPNVGNILAGNGTQFNSVTMSGDATINAAGVVTVSTGGSPSGPAGGDLSGTYPNPDVVNDSHSHTASTLPSSIVYDGDTAGGDLSGTYPNPTVAKINTATLGSTTATDKNILIADGSSWVTRAVSGDATVSNTGAVTLASTAVTAASYPSPADGTMVPTFTVDAKGRLTAAGSVAVSASGGSGGTMIFPRAFGIVQKAQINSGTTITSLFITAPTFVGTLSAVADATGTYVNHLSLTTLNAAAGWAFAQNDVQIQQSPEFVFVIKTGANATDIQNCRIWCAFVTVAALDQSDPGVGSVAGFRFSTGAGDTNWQAVTRNATSTLNTITDTGIAVAANTRYEFRIDCRNTSSLKFYINGTLVVTGTTNLPVVTGVGSGYITITNLSGGTARNIRISKFVQEAN